MSFISVPPPEALVVSLTERKVDTSGWFASQTAGRPARRRGEINALDLKRLEWRPGWLAYIVVWSVEQATYEILKGLG